MIRNDVISVQHCRHCTGAHDDHKLLTEEGEVVGTSYYGAADYVDRRAPWYSTGLAGLQAGFSTREEAEAIQVAAWRSQPS